MRFEWDEGKRAANLAKHGVDFASVEEFDFESATILLDNRKDYGENRQNALGFIGIRLHVLTFTRRGETLRIISLRKANAREVKSYEQFEA
jgi:uncharacterized DUF497 family protein